MRIRLHFVIFIGIIFLASPINGQKNLEEHVKELIKHHKYMDALEILNNRKEDDKEFYFQRGICNYHTNRVNAAIEDFSIAYDKGMEDKSLISYLAMTHHKKGEYDKAARAYKLFLNEMDKNDPRREQVIQLIKQCGFGRKAVYLEQPGFVENLGTVVNSAYDDFSPVRSPNYDNKYYFSSNRKGSNGGLRNSDGLKDDVYGHYAADIYTVESINGTWTPSTGVPPLLNSARDEIIQGFSNNGEVLIFIKSGANQPSQVVSDTFSIDVDNYPKPLIIPANAALGDQDLYFVNDSTFIFSSKRKGGFGGYDLYITQQTNGTWSDPKNLGPQINSPFDERSPFLTKSGTILYFSSNRTSSCGGFDIFSASYGIERGKWTEAKNMGVPISSPGDDLFFRLSEDGRSGIFCSDRMESMGGYDLFIAYLKDQVYEQVAYAGTIPFMEKPEEYSGVASGEDPENMETVVKTEPQEEKEDLVIEKTREIVIEPLYYSFDQVIGTGQNNKTLKNILDMMIIYPDLEVTLTGNTLKEGSKAYDLYFSIKRAEMASEYFVNNGISPGRIHIVGVGSNYPLVNNMQSPLAAKNNNRIDVYLSDMSSEGLITNYNNPVVADYLRGNVYDEYLEKTSGLNYRIQVTQVRQMYDNPRIMSNDDVIVHKDEDSGNYNYSVGLYQDYFAAREAKNALIRNGFLDVRTIVYLKGEKLEVAQIRALVDEYPDLNNYIKYELD